jgi:hypothetical protein
MEDANRSLEYQYASTFHNILDKIVVKCLDIAVPNFDFISKDNNLVIRILKEDLIAYGTYVIGYPSIESEVCLVEDILKRGEEAVIELVAWIKMWYVKWVERTKLIGSEEANNYRTALNSYHFNYKVLSLPPVLEAELFNVAVETLVEEKELACTNIMAKDLVKFALAKEHANIGTIKTVDDELALMKVVIRRTREVAHLKGPLVYIKVK